MRSEIILEMASEIEALSKLCYDLITELEQYEEAETQERKLTEIMGGP